MQGAIILKIENVWKYYGDFAAVRGVSCEIEQGKVTLIEGASGSSKTTLLGIMSGLLKPTSGTVNCNGTDIWSLTEKQLDKCRLDNFSFVFQTPNLFPALSSLDNVKLMLKWGTSLDSKAMDILAREVLCELGLEHRLHIRPQLLSGGERQRVAIARAMVKKPKYIFADEPTSALDWISGKKVVELLKSEAQKGVGVVIVSHDARIEKYTDKIIRMENGQIMQQQ